MDFLRPGRPDGHQRLNDTRPAKRISTPAGQRLSVILDSKRSKAPSAAAKISVTTTSTYCNDPTHLHIDPDQHTPKTSKKHGVVSALTGGRLGDTPRESSDQHSTNGSNLSVSVWSDRDAEKFGHVRQQKRARFGGWGWGWGWKKLAIAAAVVIALLVALAVGLAMGLKKKDTHSSTPTTTTDGSEESGGTSASPHDPATSATSTLTPSVVPSGFPVGSYSFVTFLDTVTTNCTASTNTWTCAPYTDYYSDPQKALTILNWEISGSTNAYKISTKGQDPMFGTSFQHEKLELLDAGKSTERYRFQISRTKTVNMTGTIGDAKGDFECDYGATNIQGFLYTKMQRTYPDETISISNTGNPAWPYAVRVEQTVAGGEGVPSCKTSSGEWITDGLHAQDASTLCSCLYKNWTPVK
ncbi:hypothetical protein ACN47E_002281 [Coniothyrium glycines]